MFIFILYTILVFTGSSVNCKNDFRFISYQDLQLSFSKFSQADVTSYSQLLFDIARNQVLVGARDVLYRLSLPHLQLLESSTWFSPKNTTKLCQDKGQTENNCHNYIKILLTNGDKLFVCGTNSFLPICTWREIENISRVTERLDGRAKCPYNPSANITSLISQNGAYYIGGPTDFSGSDFAIYRSIGKYNITRTKQYDSLWLNEPQFVGSFETDKFIYFLFREAAVEYMNCGKIIYSRIARVCKNDTGGQLILKDNWTTFIKARLNCSISGDYPFYFDEIQSTSYIPEENILYATFTTPTNNIAGSAICAFNLTAIDSAFSGPFKYQKHVGSPWEKHHSPYRDHFECKNTHNKHLIEISKYQLMDNAVQATTLKPLFVAELERFMHITIDVLSTKLHSTVHVIYVSTIEGLLKKLTVLPRTQETCVVEVWQPVPDTHIPILSIQYLKETNSVYVGTEKELLRIPAHHCRRHVSKDSCLNAMDPYCGWNDLEDSCTTAPNSDPLEKYWHQGVTSCPILNAPVDGGWSSWSEWTPCTHRTTSDPNSTDECLCQVRQCNNPAPQNGGKSCSGTWIAVTNCTVHGGWTAWSAWSECSATCGIAVKTRTRTCTNPAPAHGGRVCVGQDRSEALCTGNPPCPVLKAPPQDGSWGPWSAWDSCSVKCGGGFRKRVRRCDNPPPMSGGLDCLGCNIEYETCNTEQCPEQMRHTSWSTWYIFNTTSKNEYVKRRFKYTCRGPVQDAMQLTLSFKEQERTCYSDHCLNTDDLPRWSEWSECSASCGGGIQERSRICEKRNKCQGNSQERRPCNMFACKSEWGCWSDWSPCSETCGWGIRKRSRPCLGGSCKGDSIQEEPCEIAPCGTLLGWDTWTEWSICDEKQEQHRKRNCRSSNPSSNMCLGPNVETRICKIGETWESSIETSSSIKIIIGCTFLGFVIGLIVTSSAWFYCRRKKPRIPSSPHYMSAKQNPYIAVPFQERPPKKQIAHSSNSILNNVHNGTLKSVKYDYDTVTMKRNSHGLNNGHTKTELGDDKYYYG